MLGRSSRQAAKLALAKDGKPRAHPPPWSKALPNLYATFQACLETKRGCKWCSPPGACCGLFETNRSELRRWREEMRNLSSEMHDREVLLIFGPSLRLSPSLRLTRSRKRKRNSQSSTETCSTSLSQDTSEDLQQSNTNKKLRVCKARLSESGLDATSQSTSITASSKSSRSTSISLSEPQPRAKRNTSQPLPRPPKIKRNQKPRSNYHQKKRCGRATRSIDLSNVIFPLGAPKVCRRSALHFLGLGEFRVRRVCQGSPDCRTRGHRLPNSHPQFAPQWQTCVQFLHHIWHYLGEGLPHRFSIDRGDGCRSRLTLGTPQSAASESPQLLKTKSDTDSEGSDTDEDEERAISTLALHTYSLEEAGAEALRGPGMAGGAPVRYIGVVRPVALFHTFHLWCTERGLPHPGFTTFLRVLGQAKPYLKFRKAAGQHANCDACVSFKKALKRILSCLRRQELMEAYCRILVCFFLRGSTPPHHHHPARLSRHKDLDRGHR